ncbi:FecR family protein [Marinilabilia salmonicolor]|uniref:FecR family protein n=1 Tax=Marinilabilia salmonicolor TaxID=989 RepID=UPI00029AAC5D|nr:FecR domain-containing protein [Marinilabilia salmonicolor]
MQKQNTHISPENSNRFNHLPGLDLSYDKSADEVWSELSQAIRLERRINSEPVSWGFSQKIWWAAAVFIVLLGTGVFMKLYTTDVAAPLGEHITAQLPDGSSVELNAGSEIEYQPFWWFVNREVALTGEAFFDVKKGDEFSVKSSAGTTSVLGTSFNIYAREGDYQVTCYSGRVQVEAFESGHLLEIAPMEQATLTKEGGLRLSTLKNREEVVSWRNEMFMFTATPIKKVFAEIERQYAVKIQTENLPDYLYSGNFSRNQPLDRVLKMVCRPYGLNFQKTSQGYRIVND